MADYLKTRFLEVISQLLREDGYVTLQSLADKMGVSKRTMQHDVDRVEEWLEENRLTDKVILSKKAGQRYPPHAAGYHNLRTRAAAGWPVRPQSYL